jgi:hypothetical protein
MMDGQYQNFYLLITGNTIYLSGLTHPKMLKQHWWIYSPTQIPDFPLIFEEKTFFKYRFQRRNRRKLNAR